MVNLYRFGKGTVANFYGVKKVTLFRNADSPLAAIMCIDDVPEGVTFKEPEAIVKSHSVSSANDQANYVIGYQPGELDLPLHYVKSGRWWNYILGSVTTPTGTTSHTISEATTLYYPQFHAEMEHSTTAECVRRELIGNYMKSYHFEDSQNEACKHSLRFGVSKGISANNINRPTSFDARGLYPAGSYSHTVLYNSSSCGIEVLSSSWDLEYEWALTKGGDKYVTAVYMMRRNFKVKFHVRMYKKTLLQIPDDPNSYAGAITWKGKWSKSATDYLQISVNNLALVNKPFIKRIGDEEYFWEGDLEFKRTGTSAGTITMKVKDENSGDKYESS